MNNYDPPISEGFFFFSPFICKRSRRSAAFAAALFRKRSQMGKNSGKE